MRYVSFLLTAVVLAGAVLWAQPAQPESAGAAELVPLGNIAGALFRPSGEPAPHIGIVYQNGGGSLTSSLCQEMSKRGFLVLCTTGPLDTSQSGWETGALNIKNAVQFLRKQPGIDKVVLYGHSGGGAEGSFYQAVAENGIAFCQDPNRLSRCPDTLADLPPADAIVFPDAHPGLGVMSLRNVNPSLVIDGNPPKLRVIKELDPFNPDNGYKPNGSRYPLEFQERYTKAQSEVMNKLIDHALSVRERDSQDELDDPREKIIMMPESGMVHLDQFDPTVAGTMSTQKPRKLLKDDGSIVTQIIKSAGFPGIAMPNGFFSSGGVRSDSIANFLSRGSVRATDSVSEIDYCTGNSVTVCNVGYIHVPVLFIASGAGSFIADEERMYERSPSKDKDFIVVEGADHSGNPCRRCETTPGQYSNSSENMFAYISKWINDRFPAPTSPAQ